MSGSPLVLEFLGQPYRLTPNLFRLAPEEVQALVFDYLVHARGAEPQVGWLRFRELSYGTFSARTHQSYGGDELVRRLDRGRFRRAAELLSTEGLAIVGEASVPKVDHAWGRGLKVAVAALCRRGQVLAVDADPHRNLGEALGPPVDKTLRQLRDEVLEKVSELSPGSLTTSSRSLGSTSALWRTRACTS